MSKFIQIMATPETENDYSHLYALDDSGQVWVLNRDAWEKETAKREDDEE